MQTGSDNNPVANHIDFYVSALFSALILSFFHLRPVHYGVLLPSMPAVAHVLQDGHTVPVVDNVHPQNLTRKMSFIDIIDISKLVHRFQLVQKGLLYVVLLVTCVVVTYLYVTSLIFLYQSWQAVAVALSIVMFLLILGILKLFFNLMFSP